MHEFQPWPKTARLFRDIVVTEKIDGTNAAIHISAVADYEKWLEFPDDSYSLVVGGTRYVVSAQSRKRIITPGKSTDNYGFAGWVYDNAAQLVSVLGEGVHYGEWWGQGIQRNYGRDSRSFSLFNASRYADHPNMIDNGEDLNGGRLEVVPTLYHGPFSETSITGCLTHLSRNGSVAARGWATPEGICVYHTALGRVVKATLDGNDAGKWEAS